MLIALKNSGLMSKYDISSLKGILSAAAPLSKDLIQTFESLLPHKTLGSGYGRTGEVVPTCRVTQGYGLTETSPVSHVMSVEEGVTHRGSIGRLVPTFQARIVDTETGLDVDYGQRGELWFRGPCVMKGYWGNPEATKNAFAPGGWFKTGDVAVVDEEGYFYIVDRVKELIKYKGYQVPPAELEALLLEHPKVADVGVIGVYDESKATELPRAYVAPAGGIENLPEEERAAYAEELIAWVQARVANHKRLRGGLIVVDAVPKSPTGKILRKILRDRAKEEVIQDTQATRGAKL